MSNETSAAKDDFALTAGGRKLLAVPSKIKTNLVSRGLNAISVDKHQANQLLDKKRKGIAAWENGDRKLAFSILLEIANAGDAEAQMYIGFLHYHADDELCNVELALEYLTKSADQGWLQAQSTLGYLYSTEFCELDQAKFLAFHWLFKAARQGDKHSYFF